MLRRGHHAKAQAAREAARGQAPHEKGGQRGYSTGGVHGGAQDGRGVGGTLMPRPKPPRKRPRRRPDAVERAARAEVSLTKQTAQLKERNGAPDAKSPNAKPQSSAKATKGGAPARARRVVEPFVPWSRRSYAILV